MNVIIIEDEPRTAKDLNGILTGLDSTINVQAMLSSVTAAITWLKANPAPDLIFSDIQLGDGLSFEIFKEVPINVPVIFCTAFDQYAINAFESNSVDYLLKPIEEDMVERSLQKYHRIKEHYAGSTYASNLSNVITQMDVTYRQSILVHYREKIIPVKVADLCFVHASNGIVMLHTVNNQDFAVQYTIDQLETMLNPIQFFRANRQFIINRDMIQDIEHFFNRRLILRTHCQTPEKIIVSRLKAQELLRWLEH
ncbi:response regulator transcription factor [Mucilaginibacter sp. Bleaf8]|uniref:LytR/AlgR family response regulator transcription factor n=1 Tax=Mucilaginibacter sp. Bleaf8 TaxID=2834430 RepID=UPI001BCAC51A|nr:LytTR family DNA-binding domain-containing protein [Mucilaginibacter sp. Bleaf8]MBS7564813.1 response regulator transcription factor [Mucilaginibacter sp. Bleaf8]